MAVTTLPVSSQVLVQEWRTATSLLLSVYLSKDLGHKRAIMDYRMHRMKECVIRRISL